MLFFATPAVVLAKEELLVFHLLGMEIRWIRSLTSKSILPSYNNFYWRILDRFEKDFSCKFILLPRMLAKKPIDSK